MTCNQVRARELVEQYLSGQLAEDDSSTFEMHYFECERCFAELETARHVRQALSVQADSIRREPLPPAKTWLLWLAPIAAAGALGVMAVTVWQHVAQPPAPQVAQAPVVKAKDYTLLAQLTAPVYAAPTLRSADTAASQSFRAAMLDYSVANYPAAIPKLQEAARLNPKSPAPGFYLGASYLLTGDYAHAATTLQTVIDAGPNDFVKESRFLLAQAKLKQNDPAAARALLQPLAAGKGEFAGKAQAALDAINRVESGK